MSNCIFNVGVCERCGFALPNGLSDATKKNCLADPHEQSVENFTLEYTPTPPKPCPHLGPPITSDLVIIKSLCPSCGGKHKWKQTTNQVHECAEKGRCLPTYRCAKTALAEETVSGEWAQPCVTCELRPVG